MKTFYIASVTLALLFITSEAFTQLPGSWTFNQGCNYPPCTGTGITQTPAGTYRLTDFGSHTTTTMWNNTVIQMSNAWTLNFEICFGNHATTQAPPVGGEGIVFAMQSINGASGNLTHVATPTPSRLTAGGYGGGDLGIKCGQSGGAGAFPTNAAPTNQRAISVEFDVFDNTTGAGCTGGCAHAGDIPADHIGVDYDDCSGTSSNSTLGAAVQALGGGAPMRDSVWRPVSISWAPNAPVSIGTKYDRYVQASGVGSCMDVGSFVDACGNTVLWSSTTCSANRNCSIMAVSSGTLTVKYNGVVKQSLTLDLETLLNSGQNVNGTNIPKDVIFGFTSSTEGKTNYQAIRNPIFLPVTIAAFNVIKTSENSVNVKWYTASEKNSNYFVVQRSLDGKEWTNVGSPIKAAGSSNTFVEYDFSDYNLAAGLYYYRVEETDKDGAKMFSEIKSINLNVVSHINISPNPADENITIEVLNGGKEFSVELIDLNGEIHYSLHNVSGNQLNVATKDLSAGIYFVKISTENNISVQKLLIY